MPQPIIAIPAARDITAGGMEINKLNLAYSEAILRNGGVPMLLPYTEDEAALHTLLALAGGVLLPGGIDVDPALYGEAPLPQLGEVDPVRDAQELAVLRYARAHKLPVLAICRGAQILNVFAGGSLYQDIPSQLPGRLEHSRGEERKRTVHTVTTAKRTLLRELMGESFAVNSSHHQSVKEAAPGFTVCAVSEDGVIEAIENEDGSWLGLQWHPEELTDTVPRMNRLFTRFIGLCGTDFPEYWE